MLDQLVFENANDSEALRAAYGKHGLFVVRNLLDRSKLETIRSTIETMIRERLATIGQPAADGLDLDALYNKLCDVDRKFGGQVYDHVKDLPEYYDLLVDKGVLNIVASLLGTRRFQIPYDICLFRIDRPSEDKFTFDWHQDYPYNLISQNAVTAWYPLTDVQDDMGLLKVMPDAHHAVEPIEVVNTGFKPGQGGGGKSIKMARKTFDDFEKGGFEVPMKAGDVMFFHCMTPHRSGLNRSAQRRARWVMNPRYGDLLDRKMVDRGWLNVRRENFFLFPEIHPELTVNKTAAE